MDLSGLMSLAPRSLSLEVRLAGIIGRINSVFSEFNFDDLQKQAQVAPTMMLDVFENQLNEFDSEIATLSGNQPYNFVCLGLTFFSRYRFGCFILTNSPPSITHLLPSLP